MDDFIANIIIIIIINNILKKGAFNHIAISSAMIVLVVRASMQHAATHFIFFAVATLY
jgi:uncharacterized membrane protein YobD (UPF0266 family)